MVYQEAIQARARGLQSVRRAAYDQVEGIEIYGKWVSLQTELNVQDRHPE